MTRQSLAADAVTLFACNDQSSWTVVQYGLARIPAHGGEHADAGSGPAAETFGHPVVTDVRHSADAWSIGERVRRLMPAMPSGESHAAHCHQLCAINFHENTVDSLTFFVITFPIRENVTFATE
jgi:hypothetical protein